MAGAYTFVLLMPTLPRRYDLYATVNHMGSIDGGHYVAYMQVTLTYMLHSSIVGRTSRFLFVCFSLTPPADG